MKDLYGREIDYLRISLTDGCNLRCIYCMPKDNVKFDYVNGALDNDEIKKIIRITSEMGIQKIRFTGGEPLLRENIEELIKEAKDNNIKKIALTTNGILLEKKISKLVCNGLTEVNISLDTLDEEKFFMITRGGSLKKVLNAIDKSLEKNLKVKINSVVINDINYDEFLDLCKLSIDKDLDIRFIELMPIGEGVNFKGKTQEELLNKLKDNYEVKILDREKLNGPASYIKIKGAKGRIGFISPMSNHFCGDCNRIRITPDGFLKQCLHFKSGVYLKDKVKSLDDEKLKNIIKDSIYNKPKGHKFNEDKESEDKRFMFQIGG